MKLISMTDFVLLHKTTEEDFENAFTNCLNYANFLKQPLTLGMFVPVDEEGNVLLGKPLSPSKDSEWIRWENEEFEFYKAKEKVLFEGFTSPDNFKVHKGNDFDYYLIKFPIEHYRCSYAEYDNINGTIININCDVEGIIGVTLTETAIKMIYGN